MHTAHRAAGRAGLGAVMGSKKLKAKAIRGTRNISTANPTKVREIMKVISTETVTNPNILNFKHGQVGFVGSLNQLGILPTKNFQQGTYDKYEAITGETMTETILKSSNTCSQCALTARGRLRCSTVRTLPSTLNTEGRNIRMRRLQSKKA